jgi:valyl-tRNA synthetase
VQSELLFGRVPWRAALISGWGLNEQGRKLSKRDLATTDGFNRYVPDDVMDSYGADALRLWATKGRIGTDLRYNEKDIRTGRKFAVKLWNVGRFVALNLDGFTPGGTAGRPVVPPGKRNIVDRWLLSHLADAVDAATAAFEGYDYMQAHQAASRMFWSIYCDRYLEMIKDRLVPGAPAADADSARQTLWESFRVLLGLFAPFAPFITEHMYQQFYRDGEGGTGSESAVSLHVSGWPVPGEGWRSDRSAVDQMAVILDATRALRSAARLGNSVRLRALILQASDPAAETLLDQIAEPLRVAARADAVVRAEAVGNSAAVVPGAGLVPDAGVVPDTSGHPSGVDGITVGIEV